MSKRKIVEEEVQETAEISEDDVVNSEGSDADDTTADTEEQNEQLSLDGAPKVAKSFADLGLNAWLVDALNALSIRAPSKIQTACVGPILNGQDVIGSAKTGSGKTAAFALPILQKLAEDPYGVFALVLTPTRELAFQIAEQFRILGTGVNLKQSIVVGGLDMMTQALELSKRPHIVVATPGRLVDHINSSPNAVNFKRLKFLVLDEADRLLDDNFADDLEVILEHMPKRRQTLLFSATMTPEISALQFSADAKPFVYECNTRFDTVSKLDQRYLFIPSSVRDAYLAWLLRNDFDEKTIIIFTTKCRTAERLRIMLRELGLRSTALHAQMSQNDRLGSLAKFKSGIVPILIATDVGSRGLDIPTVQVVLNYELPADATDYIHRVGRTARAGRGGLSMSVVTEHDINILLNIEQKTEKKMNEYKVSEKAVLEHLNEVALAKRVANMHLMDTKFGEKVRVNKEKRQKLSGEVKVKEKAKGVKRVKA
ncbi:hypothetical protein HK097_001495 [Rhizophlyctis rosea]|uniref:RNA helicase n=1 Tax=Rhizophlyctis rosea TaxID=64517 RepID=A0AAD5SKD0_9FUNG|nr:hypothetical protein HK097_001495 [Rhizophlyctis rosea]